MCQCGHRSRRWVWWWGVMSLETAAAALGLYAKCILVSWQAADWLETDPKIASSSQTDLSLIFSPLLKLITFQEVIGKGLQLLVTTLEEKSDPFNFGFSNVIECCAQIKFPSAAWVLNFYSFSVFCWSVRFWTKQKLYVFDLPLEPTERTASWFLIMKLQLYITWTSLEVPRGFTVVVCF